MQDRVKEEGKLTRPSIVIVEGFAGGRDTSFLREPKMSLKGIGDAMVARLDDSNG